MTTDDNYGTFSLAIATMYVIRERGRKSNTVKFQNTFAIYETTIKGSDAGTGGPGGGATAPPPIFCRSVNPIQTGKGRLSPPITTGPPNVFTFRHHCVVLHTLNVSRYILQ